MAWTKTANIKGERGGAGTRSTSVFFNSSSNELVGDLKIDSDGTLYNYEKSKTQFATFDASTGTLRFWNRETVPSVGDKDPEGHNVDNVFTELNYQDDYQLVFKTIAENLKAAIAVDKVSFTNTSYMFSNCRSLTNLDLSNFNTSKVTDMQGMFGDCSSLTTLDLSKFNTSNVTSMNEMFYGCSNLTNLDLSNFDTSKVTSMSYMFDNCSSLTKLDVSNFDTSNVTDMSDMFNTCSSLTTLDLSNFDTSKVTSMSYMFDNCSSLTKLDVSNFDTSNVTDMSYMFYSCSGLTTLDLSNFDTSKVTNMNGMFDSCSNLTLDCSHWNVDKVTNHEDFNRNAPKVIPPVWKN